MTESECLVFTNEQVILVSLIDKNQRNISRPNGVGGLEHSLNVMMNGVPYLLIATVQKGFTQQIKCEIEDKYPNQCHTIGQSTDEDYYYLLTVMQYDAVEQKMNEKVNLTASALVIGDIIISLLPYSTDCIMICGTKTALILSIVSMQKIKSISINTEVASNNYNA